MPASRPTWTCPSSRLFLIVEASPDVTHTSRSSNNTTGGRTAWSSRVVVGGKEFTARFWYDGKNLNNAKEDAAELAYNYIHRSPNATW